MRNRTIPAADRETFISAVSRSISSSYSNRVTLKNHEAATLFQGHAQGYINALAAVYGRSAANDILYNAHYTDEQGNFKPAAEIFYN